MIPAPLSLAKSDPRLKRGAALAAYIFCLEYLDTQELRAMKVEQVANVLRCDKWAAVQAMRRLTRHGFVAMTEGNRKVGEPRRYRLLPYPVVLSVKVRAA